MNHEIKAKKSKIEYLKSVLKQTEEELNAKTLAESKLELVSPTEVVRSQKT